MSDNLTHWLSDVQWTSWLSKDLLTITGDWMMWNCLVDCFRAYLSSFIVPLTLLFGGWLADCLTLWLDEWLTGLTGWLNDVELICRLFEGLLKLTHGLTEGLTGWLYCRGWLSSGLSLELQADFFFDSMNDSWADTTLWVKLIWGDHPNHVLNFSKFKIRKLKYFRFCLNCGYWWSTGLPNGENQLI